MRSRRKAGLPWWLSGKDSIYKCRRGRSLTQENAICRGATRPVHPSTAPVLQSPGDATAEPVCLSYWAPHALEPVCGSRGSHWNEKPARRS